MGAPRLAILALAAALACGPDEAAGPPLTPAPPPAKSATELVPAAAATLSPAPEPRAKEPPPKPTAWRTVDLGGSSVEVPEPVAEAATGPSSGASGIKTVRATIDGIEFYAGDGPFRTFDATIARSLFGDPIVDRLDPRMFDANASDEPADVTVRDKGFDHDGGSRTLVCLAFWSTGSAKPGRVAWRIVTVGPAGQGDHKDKVFRFLESHPGPKRPGLNHWGTRTNSIKRLMVCF